jgi:UDP-N-acetylmuramate: L-alanyl-gamma-D-glutamyl-meso-diaminopimelate ligase
LNEEFLQEYKGSMSEPYTAIIYFIPSAIAHKKLKPITLEQVFAAFGRKDLLVFTDSGTLKKTLKKLKLEKHALTHDELRYF